MKRRATRRHEHGRVKARMRVLGLAGRRPRRYRRTTEADPEHDKARNFLGRRFEWPWPNQAWVGDITVVWTAEGWAYLAMLVDLCTRAIVGWAVGDRCDTELALRALDAAVARHRPRAGLLHHTDRRSTSTSALFPYIESFYNRRRLHSVPGYITPAEKEQRVTQAKAVA